MGLVPSKAIDRVQFYENHDGTFAANAVAIGTTTTAVTDLTTKTAAARTAYNAHQSAQDAAKIATQAWHQAVATMSTVGSAIINQIRAKAQVSGDGIWTLAGLPAPSTPAPVGPPGTPFDFKASLKPGGALQLKWKCENPAGSQGTLYQLGRKVDGAATFEYIGGSGTKSFTDNTLPAGSSTIIYQIQGVRSTAIGDAAEFVVNIGVGSGGGMMASVVEATSTPKMAA